jgi:nitrogen regulatory protein P-II 2
MKLIVAIVGPEKLEAVQEVLKAAEAELLSIGPVQNLAGERTGMYRGAEVRLRRPAVRLEIALEDLRAEDAAAEIVRAASSPDSGQDNGGLVFMMPLDACVPLVNRQHGTIPLDDMRLLMARCTPSCCP